MHRCLTAVACVLLLPSAASGQSQEALERFTGSWKLNVAKSKFSGKPPVEVTATTRLVDGIPFTVTEGINATGGKIYNEVTLHFSGQELPVKGTANATGQTTRVYKWIDDNTIEWVQMVNGKVTTTSRLQITGDGRTQTVTTKGVNAQGERVDSVTLWEKQ